MEYVCKQKCSKYDLYPIVIQEELEMCIRLAYLLRILLVSIQPVQASKAAEETIVYVHNSCTCTKQYNG